MNAPIESVAFPFPGEPAFDEIVDVRSPSEFAEDHIPGSINLPVLSDEERRIVGTLYQENRFEARKLGAALASARIAAHLTRHFSGKPRGYRPLLYCWRGGQRSRSLATVLSEIGWRVALLAGGYKTYRRWVVDGLPAAVAPLSLRVVNGLTGSGKTRVLRALADQGAEVLDLESLAAHKGSVFGGDPAADQPTQKWFESLLMRELGRFRGDQPVFVEAESPKIGALDLPRALWQRMRESPVIELRASLATRVEFLRRDYEGWLRDPERIQAALARLKRFHGARRTGQWTAWCRDGNWEALIGSLLVEHYDTSYGRSGASYFLPAACAYELNGRDPDPAANCAARILDDVRRGGSNTSKLPPVPATGGANPQPSASLSFVSAG